jgi:hypothetical protein
LDSTKPDYLTAQGAEARNRLKVVESDLSHVLAKFHDRLASALGYLLSCPDTAPDLNVEIRRYVSVLRSMQGLDATLRDMRAANIGFRAVLESMADSSDQKVVYNVASSASEDLKPLIERILTVTREVAYPFPTPAVS